MEECQSVPSASLPVPPPLVHPTVETFSLNQAESSGGVGNCYVFKSRLQEYAQKVGISTPVYQTVKEGPSHEPVFKCTVIVNDVKYESLPGFFNRKAAEQSAAEIALKEIHNSGEMCETIPTVHETGLCKNLLQEYAQKMNYAIPSYKCVKQQVALNPFICTVDIGRIQYIGAAARTKKEAEIKAARTALVAIQYGSGSNTDNASQYTVLPGKKKGKEKESRPPAEELKPKTGRIKKRWLKRQYQKNNKGKMPAKSGEEENKLESGGLNAGFQMQINETNGSCRNTERFEDSREGGRTGPECFQEAKFDAVGQISTTV